MKTHYYDNQTGVFLFTKETPRSWSRNDKFHCYGHIFTVVRELKVNDITHLFVTWEKDSFDGR